MLRPLSPFFYLWSSRSPLPAPFSNCSLCLSRQRGRKKLYDPKTQPAGVQAFSSCFVRTTSQSSGNTASQALHGSPLTHCLNYQSDLEESFGGSILITSRSSLVFFLYLSSHISLSHNFCGVLVLRAFGPPTSTQHYQREPKNILSKAHINLPTQRVRDRPCKKDFTGT